VQPPRRRDGMEEKELNQRLYDMFKEMLLVLERVKQGFFTQSQTTLMEAETKLTAILTSNLPFTEDLVKKERKNDAEKKYVNLLPQLQLMAVNLRNLINEKKKKIESNLLFTDKAMNEIKELYALLQTQFRDATDYILTRNSHLRMHIKTGMENLFKRADEYVTGHETRLITGVCMPKASYSYLAIVDSIKAVSRELTSFSEKL
jgi:Na+/phosphate symporter